MLPVLRGYEAWPHQVDALERAQRENIILNLPTGTGKTLVACLVESGRAPIVTAVTVQFHDIVT